MPPPAAARSLEASPDEQPSEDARLARLFADDARREDALDPLDALYRGARPDPAMLAQLYTDTLDDRLLASAEESLRALGEIDRAKLSPGSQISYDVFARSKEEQAEWLQPALRSLTAVRPFNHFGGLHVEFSSLMSSEGAIRFDSEADYRDALVLDGAFGKVLDNAIARFRQGMASGVVETKVTTRNMIAQLDAMTAQAPEQSPFYSPVLKFPASMPEPRRAQLREAYAAVIRETIYPAYGRLRRFLADEYLPAARDQVGISAMKQGTELYVELIKRETTLELDPEKVHALGLSEVARIQREMDGVRREMAFSGNLRAFFDYIRTDPQFHPKTAQELADGFAAVAKQVDAQIPRFFLKVPRTPLLIQPYPAFRAKYEAGASYNQGASDGSRPGIFYFNTYDLPSRFLTGMTTLYLHEGIPGHHFQISLAQEDTSLPSFQRFEGNNAFVEGWALYAETLGYAMGFYKDPRQHWGTLDDEMLRAMRLVVDTGIHAEGWTRDQSIDYMLANSGMGRSDATAEVERYIAMPGQALSYKIGAMTIQRLRAKAESALGPKFDIRQFHQQVLGSGALPLPVLEAKIDRWIEAGR
ncbi:DUF885 family protein [Novosphingobium sp. G106]|uniref:DUF885 domain-containing protein n=1 Tax=Novosphingobium sp. G106 TaxID=2849500 RepID=UPI0020C3D596|nr:DUF885 domain-containing protein [Novosphingobium sp. G106]